MRAPDRAAAGEVAVVVEVHIADQPTVSGANGHHNLARVGTRHPDPGDRHTVLVGAVPALSFARDPEDAEAATATATETTTAEAPALKSAQAPAELFQPRGEPAVAAASDRTMDPLDVEELLASLEQHIRTEREAAAARLGAEQARTDAAAARARAEATETKIDRMFKKAMYK